MSGVLVGIAEACIHRKGCEGCLKTRRSCNMRFQAAFFDGNSTRMNQTLCSHFSLKAHRPAGSRQLPARRMPVADSLEALLAAMQEYLLEAKQDLLQPRPQAVARILLEAARLH
jgi:hypothetical protein